MDVDDISGASVSGGSFLNVIANPSIPTGHLYTWEEIAAFIANIWRARDDRYSALRSSETAVMKKIEMSYIGG